MDIKELRKLIKNSTSVLVMDNGEPAFVVVDYQVYKNAVLDKEKDIKINHQAPVQPTEPLIIKEKQQNTPESREIEILERLNREIQSLKDQIQAQEREAGVDF